MAVRTPCGFPGHVTHSLGWVKCSVRGSEGGVVRGWSGLGCGTSSLVGCPHSARNSVVVSLVAGVGGVGRRSPSRGHPLGSGRELEVLNVPTPTVS
jgi:hypothetical protein